MLSQEEILTQSKNAFNQWRNTWEANAKENSIRYKKDGRSHQDYLFTGTGRLLICISGGPSFEHNLEIIKKYSVKDGIDIICVDKMFSPLIENGIQPKYVVVADAGIEDKWFINNLNKTKDTTLIANMTANPKWTRQWLGDVLFYVNKDNIESEKIYSEISGCFEYIPASSNVGNSIVVFATQIFNYDEYLMIGFDNGWKDNENYYAFSDSDKRYWMKHVTAIDTKGNIFNTSENLLFSSKWLNDFYVNCLSKLGVKIFNCSEAGIINYPRAALAKRLEKFETRKITDHEKTRIVGARIKQIGINNKDGKGAKQLQDALQKYNVININVNYIPQEVIAWLATN